MAGGKKRRLRGEGMEGGVGGVDIAEPDIFFSILFFLPLFLPSFYTYGTYG